MRSSKLGFTLLEVVIALIITLMVMAALLQSSGIGLAVSHRVSRLDQAVARARSRLVASEHGVLAAGERGGEDGGGFRWRTIITQTARTRRRPGKIDDSTGLALFTVTTIVSWQEGASKQSVSLATQAIGAAMGEAP